ncbi:MAG: ABC transporter permease [Egibacteraceae bacterium]
MRRFLTNRTGVAGLLLATVILLFVVVGPVLYERSPVALDLANKLEAPNGQHLLGTDQFGRDQLARLLDGGRRSLLAGAVALLMAYAIGLIVGVTAGLAGGLGDTVLMRTVDVVLAIPGLVLSLAIVAVLGPGLPSLMIAVVGSLWAGYGRLARSMVATANTRKDVIAARMAGLPGWRIAIGHVLPTLATQLVIVASVELGEVLVIISGLSFLGLGVQPPLAEWGSMLGDARLHLRSGPWLIYAPVTAIVLSVLAANLISSGLCDAADARPRLAVHRGRGPIRRLMDVCGRQAPPPPARPVDRMPV